MRPRCPKSWGLVEITLTLSTPLTAQLDLISMISDFKLGTLHADTRADHQDCREVEL